MNEVIKPVKTVVVNGREFTLYEPAGYEVDNMIVRFFDDDLQPIREKIPEANVSLITMCFKLTPEEVKALPNGIYRRLLSEAAAYFEKIAGEHVEEEVKK